MGEWNGFLYESNDYPARPMLSLRFRYSGQEGEVLTITASGVEFDGDPFDVLGTCTVKGGTTITEVKWSIDYSGGLKIYYAGHLADEFTIVGTRGYGKPDEVDWTFVMKKVPADVVIFRPHPASLAASDPTIRYRALWRYGISAVLHSVRRRWWAWSYFSARRDVRKSYIELDRLRLMPHKSEDFKAKLRRTFQMCTARDARFYDSISEYLQSTSLCAQ